MSNKSNKRGKNAQFFPRQFFWCPRPAHDPNAWNRLRKKLRKQLRKPQNNTAFAKISYLVNNCKPVSVGNSANVVFVARFSNQIVCFSTTSRDRKLPRGKVLPCFCCRQVTYKYGFSASGFTISCNV